MKTMTNNELFTLAGILSQMKVCAPGIPAEVSAKLIDAVCEVQAVTEGLQKRIDLIREQTRPAEVASPEAATDEQRLEWEKAIVGQLEILGAKPASVRIAPLTAEEFAAAVAPNTLTGAQAVLLRRALVTAPEPPEQKGGGDE